MKFKWSNAQINKQQNKTKMCRLREDWAQWIDLGLILLKSVLLFQVTYCSVTKLISPNSTISVNDFHEYKSTPHTNQMNYIQNNKDHGDTNTSKLAVVAFQVIQIGCRSAFLFSIKELVIIFITFAIYRSKWWCIIDDYGSIVIVTFVTAATAILCLENMCIYMNMELVWCLLDEGHGTTVTARC